MQNRSTKNAQSWRRSPPTVRLAACILDGRTRKTPPRAGQAKIAGLIDLIALEQTTVAERDVLIHHALTEFLRDLYEADPHYKRPHARVLLTVGTRPPTPGFRRRAR